MSWRAAFLLQARSDDAVRQLLNRSDVAYSHRLHYLQMVTEKLAKGFLTSSRDKSPPPLTHTAFVRLMRIIKVDPRFRRHLGYRDTTSYIAFVTSLMPLAEHIERLAPSKAATTAPNPEYPWLDQNTGQIWAPAEFDFQFFHVGDPRMIELERLIAAMLHYAQ